MDGIAHSLLARLVLDLKYLWLPGFDAKITNGQHPCVRLGQDEGQFWNAGWGQRQNGFSMSSLVEHGPADYVFPWGGPISSFVLSGRSKEIPDQFLSMPESKNLSVCSTTRIHKMESARMSLFRQLESGSRNSGMIPVLTNYQFWPVFCPWWLAQELLCWAILSIGYQFPTGLRVMTGAGGNRSRIFVMILEREGRQS